MTNTNQTFIGRLKELEINPKIKGVGRFLIKNSDKILSKTYKVKISKDLTYKETIAMAKKMKVSYFKFLPYGFEYIIDDKKIFIKNFNSLPGKKWYGSCYE